MLSIATAVYSKIAPTNSIEKFLEEYLERVNTSDKIFNGTCNFINM